MPLRLVEFLLGLHATGAAPVVGQLFKGHAVVLGRVIDIAADGADILAAGFLLGEVHLGQNRRHRIVEVNHALGLQVLVSLRAVGAAIHRRMVADEFAHSVQRFAGSRR